MFSLSRSTTSTCSLPSIGARQPSRKKLEDVSGFVVVTKQSYFKPIRKKQQNRQRSPEKEPYRTAHQKHSEHYNQRGRTFHDLQELKDDEETKLSGYKSGQHSSKLSDMRMVQLRSGATSKCGGICNEGRDQMRFACDEKENNMFAVMSNKFDNADFETNDIQGLRSIVLQNKSREIQSEGHSRSAEERRDDSKSTQTVAEEECQEPSARCRMGATGHTRQQRVCALDAATDEKTLDKIEAIEGWIKIYESEFFSERNKEADNKILNTPVKNLMQNNTALSTQEPCGSGTGPGSEPANRKAPTGYMHSYIDATGSLKQDECATIPEYSGSHPITERANNSASVERNKQDLESLKYISAESFDETEFKQKKCGNKSTETSFPKSSIKMYQMNEQQINHEQSNEHFCNPIININTESNILEDISLTSINDSKHRSCSSKTKDKTEEGVSLEPTCKAVRVSKQQYEQSCPFPFMARSDFKRQSRAGKNATLEEIEAMIEPKLQEPSPKKQTYKDRKSDKTGTKTEPNRTNINSLIPDIVQVKLGIENQSKILDKLDLMMKCSEVVEQSTYKINNRETAFVQCSEDLVSEYKVSSETGSNEVTSCRPFDFLSDTSHSKQGADSECSGISEVNKSQGQCNVSSECTKVSVRTHMSGGGIAEQRHLVPQQCHHLHDTSQGHSTGEWHYFISQLQ